MCSSDLLTRFQQLFSFTRVIGGLARLSPKGSFEGFTNVINVSYPEEWLRLYWQEGYFEVDPVFQTALQKPGTQHWQSTYKEASSEKQRQFMAAAQEFGLGDGITTGSADLACRVATFCSFASSTVSMPRTMYPSWNISDITSIWRCCAPPPKPPSRPTTA